MSRRIRAVTAVTQPSAALRRTFLSLFIVALGADPVSAQWPTTRWRVTQEGGAPSEDRREFVRNELDRSSAWLDGLRFKAPAFFVSGEALGKPFYHAYYDETLKNDCGGDLAAYYGTSDHSVQALYFGKGTFERKDQDGKVTEYTKKNLGDGPVTYSAGYLLAPVHEVFHGVQHGYAASWPPEPELLWLIESTAEAVRYAWGEKAYGSIQVRPRMSYDLPLHEPFIGTGCSANIEYYDTGHFWYHLGADIGSTDRIGYLHEVFLSDPEAADGGLGAIDAALQQHDNDGLYNLYPQFIARHAADSSFYRYEQVVRLTPASFRHIDRTAQLKPLRGMAASAWVVSAVVPPNTSAGLTVRLEQDHPDMHLIVDTTRYDLPAPRDERNVFRSALEGQEQPYEFLVRVVNVAPDAAKSDDQRFTIEFSLAEVDECDARQLWAATHPAAQQMLMPPQQYQQQYESAPGTQPAAGTLRFQGLLSDGGVSCTHPLTISANPSAPDTDMGLRMQQRVSQMSPQELMAIAQRMTAQSKGGQPPTMEQMLKALSEEPAVDSLMTKSTGLHVFSPNAVFWQRGAQPKSTGIPDITAYKQDAPAVAWSHGGLGGWQANSGGHVMIIIPDVAPDALREDSTYDAVGAMHYSRGEGVLKKARANASPNSDASWQGLEGWIEQVESDPSTEPYSLKGTVKIERITGAVVEGTFHLLGMGHYARSECPPNPMNLGSISATCKTENRDGAISVSGEFAAPAVASTPP